jgi:hypothetical protein
MTTGKKHRNILKMLHGEENLPKSADNNRHYMVQQRSNIITKRYGMPTDLLPAYVQQTPVTFSAKDLLKQNNVGISSIAFNKLMMIAGLLEERERLGSKGNIKKYKVLTEQGLAYGQNDTNPHNPREVQIHYYADKFPELLRKLNL